MSEELQLSKTNEQLKLNNSSLFRIQEMDSPFLSTIFLNEPFVINIQNCSTAQRTLDATLLSVMSQSYGGYKGEAFDSMRNSPNHDHAFIEITLVLSGNLQEVIENQTFVYGPGQVCVMNRNIQHHEVWSEDFQAVFLLLREDFLLELFEEFSRGYPNYQGSCKDNPLYQLVTEGRSPQYQFEKIYLDCFPKIHMEQTNQLFSLADAIGLTLLNLKPGALFELKSLLTKLIFLITDPELYVVTRVSPLVTNQEFLMRKIDYLLRASNGRCTREQLAKQLHYNSDYINRVVKKFSGKSLKEYGQEICMEETKKLLEDTNLSISDIIRRMGFSNRSYFYRVFKEFYGETPLEYREKFLQAQNQPG